MSEIRGWATRAVLRLLRLGDAHTTTSRQEYPGPGRSIKRCGSEGGAGGRTRSRDRRSVALPLVLILAVSGSGPVSAQNPGTQPDTRFVGTFTTGVGSALLQMKWVDGGVHGLLVTGGGSVALDGAVADGVLEGRVYLPAGPVPFRATPVSGGLSIAAAGSTDVFHQVSTEHELHDVDLSPYLTAAEVETVDDAGLRSLVAGSRLVYYTRTSYLNDSMASSLTYVNFCPDGTFTIQTEGSFSVEGDYGGNAHGASSGGQAGTWELAEVQGAPVVRMAFADGSVTVNPIDRARLQQGRWRDGNTQYAVERGRAVCP